MGEAFENWDSIVFFEELLSRWDTILPRNKGKIKGIGLISLHK